MKTGAESFLRQIAGLLAGEIAKDLCREEAKRQMREPRPDELSAYHESAHHVVRTCFGFPVEGLRLLDHLTVKGICLTRPWDDTIDLDELPSDQQQVNQFFFYLHVCGYRVSIPRLKRVVRRLLKKHWREIRAVAERLLSAEWLDPQKESRSVTKTEILATLEALVAVRPEGAGTNAGNHRGTAQTLATSAKHSETDRGSPGAAGIPRRTDLDAA